MKGFPIVVFIILCQHSLSSEGELMLTLLASVAQEESQNLSENIRMANPKEV